MGKYRFVYESEDEDNTVSITCSSDISYSDLVEKFRDFSVASGYHPQTVAQAFGEDDDEDEEGGFYSITTEGLKVLDAVDTSNMSSSEDDGWGWDGIDDEKDASNKFDTIGDDD